MPVIEFIERYGGPLVFAFLFLNQLGLPIPATPFVLTLGALAGRGSIDPLSTLLIGTAASLCADLLWYDLGRLRGPRVLGFLCRISLEPDTCVSKTQGLFSRHGVKSLLVAKFVPGFGTVAPPIAGMLAVGRLRFALWSTAGALLWLATIGALGYAFNQRLEALAEQADVLGSELGLIVAALFGAYLAWKFLVRRRVLRELRLARIDPEELHRMILAGEDPAILDVRHELAIEALPVSIPGALFITLEELDRRHQEIPRERDVIVYCS